MAYRKKKRPEGFCSTKMKKELILKRLREKKYRITKQRQMLLDVILQEECASCKEIYYKAKKEDSSIGAAISRKTTGLSGNSDEPSFSRLIFLSLFSDSVL